MNFGKYVSHLRERGLWSLSVHQDPAKPETETPELMHVDMAIIGVMVRDFALDRLGQEVAKQVAETYVKEHYQELVSKIDVDALVAQVGIAIANTLVKTALGKE